MKSTGYFQDTNFYSEYSEKHWETLQFKRKQMRDGIASEQRQAIIRKRRNTHFYPNNPQMPPNSQFLTSLPISTVNMLNIPEHFQLQQQKNQIPYDSIQPLKRNFQNQPNQADQHISYQNQQGQFINQDPVHQNLQINYHASHDAELTVPQFQQEPNHINQFAQQNYNENPSQNQAKIGLPQQASTFFNSQVHNQIPMGIRQFSQPKNHFMMSPPPQEQSFWMSPHNSPQNNTSPPTGLDFTFFRPFSNSPDQNIIPSHNNNFNFMAPQYSPPQISQHINYMEFSFSNQFNNILPSNINCSPEERNSPEQSNCFAQNILSNGKIIQDPHYVNPYLEFVEQEAKSESSKHILEETKKKMEEMKWKNQEINIISGHGQREIKSPFTKHKRIPEPYSAFQVSKEVEKKNYQEHSVQNLGQNKKKPKKQTPLTGVKRLTKEVQQKANPQNKKKQTLVTKNPQPKQQPIKKDPNQNQNVKSSKKEQKPNQNVKTSKIEQAPSQHVKSSKKQQAKPTEKIIAPQTINPLDILMKQNKIMKLHKHYIIFDKLLGKGSFASVYLGISSQLKQKVAVKKMKIKRLKQMCEVEYLKEMNHKNVIMLYDYFKEEDTKLCYLFLQFCEENLRQRLQKITKLKLGRQKQLQIRISYVEQLIEGMNVLNYKGFIHRDLKFENILVKDDVLKIGDFGLCRKLNQKLQIESIRCGTPYTMAPEIYFHPKDSYINPVYTEKTDIFSLAVLFHELIYNTHPFDYEERHLKTLNRIDVSRNQTILKKVCLESQLDITWIKEIIDKGLTNLEDRLTWQGLMEIYKNRHSSQDLNKALYQNPTNKQKENQKPQNSTDISNNSFFKKSLELTIKEVNKSQKIDINGDQKGKSKENNISKQIINRQQKKEKENISQTKQQKLEPKKIQSQSSRKQKFDIIEEAKKVFGDPNRSNQFQGSPTSQNNSRIISFDDFSDIDSSVYMNRIRQNTKVKNNVKQTQKMIQSSPADTVCVTEQQKSCDKNNQKEGKMGKKLFSIFATIIIMWACVIIFGKLFIGNSLISKA